MDWIACSESIPLIPEKVLVTNGHEVLSGHIWCNESGGFYFEIDGEEFNKGSKFLVIWWMPVDGGLINQKPNKYLAHLSAPEHIEEDSHE
jgi:hypothetical protein